MEKKCNNFYVDFLALKEEKKKEEYNLFLIVTPFT